MPKNVIILIFAFLMINNIYGQKSKLLQNINFRAKELKHSINKEGDSLIFECERLIYSIEIFNQDYEKIVQVGSKKTKIALNDTPLGRLVVQAKLEDKRILMTLLRHQPIDAQPKTKPIPRPTHTIVANVKPQNELKNNTFALQAEIESKATYILRSKTEPKIRPDNVTLTYVKSQHELKNSTFALKPEIESKAKYILKPKVAYNKPKSKEPVTASIDKVKELPIEEKATVKIVKHLPNEDDKKRLSVTDMLNWKKKSANSNTLKNYWIAEEINSGTNISKSMRLVNEQMAIKLISKNKIEALKTSQGKLNTLIIWEIYDVEKFLKMQTNNPDYIYSSKSELFNVVPYFHSDILEDKTSLSDISSLN